MENRPICKICDSNDHVMSTGAMNKQIYYWKCKKCKASWSGERPARQGIIIQSIIMNKCIPSNTLSYGRDSKQGSGLMYLVLCVPGKCHEFMFHSVPSIAIATLDLDLVLPLGYIEPLD